MQNNISFVTKGNKLTDITVIIYFASIIVRQHRRCIVTLLRQFRTELLKCIDSKTRTMACDLQTF